MELPEISSPYPTPKKKNKEKKTTSNQVSKCPLKISTFCAGMLIYYFFKFNCAVCALAFLFSRRGYEWTSESSHNNSGLMHGLGIYFVLSYKLSPRINQISIE